MGLILRDRSRTTAPRPFWPSALLVLLTLVSGACSETPDPSAYQAAPDGDLRATNNAENAVALEEAETLDWNDLIPPEWRPERLLSDYDVDSLSDDDPLALELMDRLTALWAEAPVVADLDDRPVRLPGFVVPLEMDATAMTEFLLVPYLGACIHVPPPPANQIVLVRTRASGPYEGGLFDTVWVVGRMRVARFSDELGEAGYRIEDARVSPY